MSSFCQRRVFCVLFLGLRGPCREFETPEYALMIKKLSRRTLTYHNSEQMQMAVQLLKQ